MSPPEGSGIDGDGDDGPPAAVCEYGVCMVDATTATFSLGQFADDPARSRLRTLLAQQLPVEIVMQKVRLSLRSYGHEVNILTMSNMLSAPQIVWNQLQVRCAVCIAPAAEPPRCFEVLVFEIIQLWYCLSS